MAALREETDRVAHIESTITSNFFLRKMIFEYEMELIFILFLGIQSNQQERIKRKANLEATIKQTAARLERAQLLSYSLEEESERWKANLIEVDKSLQVLVGNTVIVVRSSTQCFCQPDHNRFLVIASHFRALHFSNFYGCHWIVEILKN